MLLNYGFNTVRFLAPVASGSRVRGRFALKTCIERSAGQWQSTLGATVEIEAEAKPALIAEWLTLLWL
jgi:acyl dehydratase